MLTNGGETKKMAIKIPEIYSEKEIAILQGAGFTFNSYYKEWVRDVNEVPERLAKYNDGVIEIEVSNWDDSKHDYVVSIHLFTDMGELRKYL